MLGQKIKELRESKGLLQRQIAAELNVDSALISKIESSDKPISKSHLKSLSKILGITESELNNYWLADKILQVVNNEPKAIDALLLVFQKLNINEPN
jgi:transcriptional regulator with XRE-family HTH domain